MKRKNESKKRKKKERKNKRRKREKRKNMKINKERRKKREREIYKLTQLILFFCLGKKCLSKSNNVNNGNEKG